MKIQNLFTPLPAAETRQAVTVLRNGAAETKDEMLLCEHLISVYVNDVLTMKLVCTPQYLPELVLGRLLTEGMIRGSEDVERIYICEHGARARVFLKESVSPSGAPGRSCPSSAYVEQDPTCCTDNHILNDTFRRYQKLKPLPAVAWTGREAFALADHFKEDSPLHSQTRGAHSCTLAMHGQILFSCEDIGRHNAVDKAIGYALRQEVPLHACMVYSSGRIPVDMARKVILAGIPVLISKAVPTREAVDLAKTYHLTLLCSARSHALKQFA